MHEKDIIQVSWDLYFAICWDNNIINEWKTRYPLPKKPEKGKSIQELNDVMLITIPTLKYKNKYEKSMALAEPTIPRGGGGQA